MFILIDLVTTQIFEKLKKASKPPLTQQVHFTFQNIIYSKHNKNDEEVRQFPAEYCIK